MFKEVNLVGVFALIAYPIILIVLAISYAATNQLGWFEAILFLAGYYGSNITVGIGFHRLWSHDTYKTNKFVEFILILFSAGTLQGPALSWASNHFMHHTYTDTEKDPHTPLKYKSRIMGFLWSHMGWMLVGEGSYKSIDRVTIVKHGRNKLLRWQLKYYWHIAILMNTLVPAAVGYAFGGTTVVAAYAGFLFIGLGRAVQQQVTFFVNSLCHFVGTQKYTNGTSRDIWWLALLLLGENWHNFHHAFPSDYRNGHKWHQFDVHKWIIYLMSKCGLAWGLKRTAEARVEAKIFQTADQVAKFHKEKLELMQTKVDELDVLCQQKIQEMENAPAKAKKKFWQALSKAHHNLDNIRLQLQRHMKNFENPSEKIINAINKKLKKAEDSLQKLYSEIERIKSYV
jgi:stearoyl-CoA desaturase (delta-9 desaturase)